MFFKKTKQTQFAPRRECQSITYIKTILICVLTVIFMLPALSAPLGAQDDTPWPELTEPSIVRVLLTPEVETILAGEMAGRIEQITKDIGDRFQKGDVLVRFDCAMQQAQLEKAQAELAAAQKTLAINRKLEKLGSVSELEMALADAEAVKAKAEFRVREAQTAKCVIKAPFTGRTIQRLANPFQYLNAGHPVLEIIDDSKLNLKILAPSDWSKHIRFGRRFKVLIDETGKTYDAKITALGARVDPVSKTLELRAVICGRHPELIAGMSGTANFK